MPTRTAIGPFLAILVLGVTACGQSAPPSAPPPTPSADPQTTAPSPQPGLDNVPPSLRLGLRAAFVQSRMPVTPTVVIVPDERSFVAAISTWNLDGGVRFPVLIDDGSWAARRAISRFVFAFKPKQVTRWSVPADAPAWPADAAARRTLIEQAAAKPWGINIATGGTDNVPLSGDALAAAMKQRWSAVQFKPPGLIVASVDDPAWPAALTLACARGQPIAWTTAPGNPSGHMSMEEADTLEQNIERLAEATGWSWSALGDDLDAVTICLNCSTKVFVGEAGKGDQRAMLALTDVIGRKVGPATDKSRKDRWAWSGLIIGKSWNAAYSAMSAVFLRPEAAWLFDGYDDTTPWNQWDATEAATALEKSGLVTTVDDNFRRGLNDWRGRTTAGVGAGLIAVNTSGNPDFFELKPGMGKPADLPILTQPAIVFFVHSWSAANPSDARTVAGRWLARGAYAYVGSVHEPYLQAFCPTPKLMQRLIVGLPLGVAARIDNGDVWKINIFGDPLITLGRTAGIALSPVVERPIGLDGARDVQTDLTESLRAGDFARSLNNLTLLGRDRDAARLLEAALREQRGSITPEAALAGLTGAFLAGDLPTLFSAYSIAQQPVGTERDIEQRGLWDARDMLWHAAFTRLDRLPRDQAQLLGLALRTETLVRDAREAYNAVRAAVTPEVARDVISRALKLATTDTERRELGQIGR